MRLSSWRSRQQTDRQALEDRHQGYRRAVDVAAPAADQLEHVRRIEARRRFCGIIELLVVYRSAIFTLSSS